MSGYHDSYGSGGYHHPHHGYNPNAAGPSYTNPGGGNDHYDDTYGNLYGTATGASAGGVGYDYPSVSSDEDEDTTSGGFPEVEEEEGEGEEDDVIDFDDPSIAELPRILLMGPRRAGKTSIQRVVFHKMSPHETLFRLEATQNLERAVVDHTPLCRFTIWDFPGDYYGPEYSTDASFAPSPVVNNNTTSASSTTAAAASVNPNQNNNSNNNNTVNDSTAAAQPDSSSTVEDGDAYIFGRATALIFVIDAQDEPYDHVLQNFTETVTRAIRANPHIAMEVFINKVDGELFLSDDAKYDCRRDVMQQVAEDLADAGVQPDSVAISYHLTSIYDHSVFEAFSRVVQKLIPQLPTLENLLNVLVSTCSMEKAYLFDVASKLYISTDSSPVDMQSVELCSDMIDVVLDVSGIYGHHSNTEDLKEHDVDDDDDVIDNHHHQPPLLDDTPANTNIHNIHTGELQPEAIMDTTNIDAVNANELHPNNDIPSHITGDNVTSMDNTLMDTKDELVGTLISQQQNGNNPIEEEEEDEDSATYDQQSSSIIRLSNGMVLYLKEVDTMLALVCLTRAENFRKKSLINYNIGCLKKALRTLVTSQPEATTATTTTPTTTPTTPTTTTTTVATPH